MLNIVIHKTSGWSNASSTFSSISRDVARGDALELSPIGISIMNLSGSTTIADTMVVNPTQADKIRGGVDNRMVNRSLEDVFQSTTTDTSAPQANEAGDWVFVGPLQRNVDGEKVSQKDGRIHAERQDENSDLSNWYSIIHAGDFDVQLDGIKCDGIGGEFPPKSLRELFFCNNEQLAKLLKSNGLSPAKEYRENFRRCLNFLKIVRASTSEQSVVSEGQEELDSFGYTTDTEDERSMKEIDIQIESPESNPNVGWFTDVLCSSPEENFTPLPPLT